MSLLLVVPVADDGPEARRLLALATALAGLTSLRILVWASGSTSGAFAALAPTVDAGEVNTWAPAQALARARLAPAARLAKNRRLRALLAPLDDVGAVLVGGLDGLPALGWTSPSWTGVIVRAGAVPGVAPEALAGVDLLVAADAEADAWLAGVAGRRARHALLEGQEPAGPSGGRIGLVGWTAEEVGRIAGGRAAADPDVAVTWFAEEQAAWGLWQGPAASPFARHVHVAPPVARAEDVADLAVLIVGQGGPVATELGALAATRGTSVHRVGSHGTDAAIAVPVSRPSPVDPAWTLGVAAGAEALIDALPQGWSATSG